MILIFFLKNIFFILQHIFTNLSGIVFILIFVISIFSAVFIRQNKSILSSNTLRLSKIIIIIIIL